MISNFLSLNKITKKYRVKLDSRDKNSFRVHIRDTIVKFPANVDRLYLSKTDYIF